MENQSLLPSIEECLTEAEQLHTALQTILETNHQMCARLGHCPWCGQNEYEADDGSYHLDHDDECAVTMIVAALRGPTAQGGE